jgi:hypothetical protein
VDHAIGPRQLFLSRSRCILALAGLALRPAIVADKTAFFAASPHPQPAARTFLSRLAANCDRNTTIRCQFGYVRSDP